LGIKLVGGYDMHKKSGLMLLGRAGLRYNSFQVADVGVIAKNPATIPSEIQISPTIGAGIALPKLTPTIGLRFVLDAFLVGTSIKQTKGLEDGATPSARGVNVGAMFNYKWKAGLDIQATYDLNFASVQFGAPVPTSLRNHMGTSVSRTDIFHMLTVGISKGF
ncbi:MAG: hypothetical protein H0T79_08915, partial [Deltaproteobacteria bacterium]|nr:hypothetical protein [Deltaproteobacteria bacterium]